jgi:hypothetical protein
MAELSLHERIELLEWLLSQSHGLLVEARSAVTYEWYLDGQIEDLLYDIAEAIG